MKPGDKIYLLDANSLIMRAYHGTPPMETANGEPVAAVYSYAFMLWEFMKPDKHVEMSHIIACFDPRSRRNWRHDLDPSYKSSRSAAPDDLPSQMTKIRRLTEAFGIKSSEVDGYEADDLLATYTMHARQDGADVTLVTHDKDLMQLIRPGVVMLDTMKHVVLTEEDVVKKFGVEPALVSSALALMGDKADDIPGVPKVGVIGAAKLLKEYGTLKKILDNARSVKPAVASEFMMTNREAVERWLRMTTVDYQVPIDVTVDQAEWSGIRLDTLMPVLDEFGFRLIAGQIKDAFK